MTWDETAKALFGSVLLAGLAATGLWLLWCVAFSWQWFKELSIALATPDASGKREWGMLRRLGDRPTRIVCALIALCCLVGSSGVIWEIWHKPGRYGENSYVQTRLGDLVWDKTVTREEGEKLGSFIDEQSAPLQSRFAALPGGYLADPRNWGGIWLKRKGQGFELTVPVDVIDFAGQDFCRWLTEKAQREVFNNQPVVLLIFDRYQQRARQPQKSL